MINTRVPSNLLVSRIAVDIVKKQNALAAVQEQISTGKKIIRPSDAPAESAHLISMKETINRLDQYTKNAAIAESQLSLEEGALDGTTSALTRVRELALRANNGPVNQGFLDEINAEIKLKLDELYALGNARDSFGNYLFAGSNILQKPFQEGNPITYSGSDETTKMEIALGRTIETGDSGIDVFMRIRGGNGKFLASAMTTNTGAGIIERGSVADSTLYQGGEYDIIFTSPTSYNIIDKTTGAAITTGAQYESNGIIEVSGATTSISGIPDTGDIFTIEPSPNQDMFSSVSTLVEALKETPENDNERARLRSDIDLAVVGIDNALNHINTVRARVGTRLSSIDSSREENENLALQIERTKRDVEDADIADVVTKLQMQANSLEILQKSFTRIEGLSLFNYL